MLARLTVTHLLERAENYKHEKLSFETCYSQVVNRIIRTKFSIIEPVDL